MDVAALETRRECPDDGFDFGQLWHSESVSTGVPGKLRRSRR
jgi:hypothetical protein